jgi:hypothetical protein
MAFAAVLLQGVTETTAAVPGYSVGWFSLALINAGLAQSHHRSGLNWFLLSLLLGPIATFILVTTFKKV